MNRKRFGSLCAAGLALGLASQAHAAVNSYLFGYTSGFGPKQLIINGSTVLNAVSSGWYSDAGFHASSNNNYIVGNCLPAICDGGDGATRNDFFVFDLSGVAGPITSASLSIANPSAADNIDPPFSSDGFGGVPTTYTTWDVSTSIAALTADATNATGTYADLGSGVFYGSTPANASTNGAQVMVALDGAALAEIRGAEGGQFAIGGTLGAVPEPATWALMLIGFGSLGAAVRARRERPA